MSNSKQVVETARKAFNSGVTRDVQWRLKQLQGLLDLVEENAADLKQAVAKDLNKPGFEADLMELMVLKNEIYCTQKNIHSWMKPNYPPTMLAQKLDTIMVQPEPYGVTLVIGAWNYPINLLLCPVVGAIAAGNCCVIKPSEISENTATLIAKLVPQYLDKDCFQVFCGGIPETTALLEEKFDYIFFTGSTGVGKIVMRAAAENLTPVTLELGGKSPCYIDQSSDLSLVAKRVMWGKLANMGQTCIAPDYIMCHSSIQDKLVEELRKAVAKFYGEDPQKSRDLGRIVNERNFKRLSAVMEAMPAKKLAFGGKSDPDDKYIEPTVYTDVTFDDSVMREELFGPLLPILTVAGPHEAADVINARDKPLAIYVFSNDPAPTEHLLSTTSSGGVMVNDTLMHSGASNVPFGGVGASGIGRYHGKHSFDTFSHMKPVWKRKQNMEALIAARYPPYNEANLNKLTMLMTEKSSYCSIM